MVSMKIVLGKDMGGEVIRNVTQIVHTESGVTTLWVGADLEPRRLPPGEFYNVLDDTEAGKR